MKYLIIFLFIFGTVLYASDETLFDEISDPSLMNLPDATVISLDEPEVKTTKPKKTTPAKPIEKKQPQKPKIEPKPTITKAKKQKIEKKDNFILLKSDKKDTTKILKQEPKPKKLEIKKIEPKPKKITKKTPKPKYKKPKQPPIVIVKNIKTKQPQKPKTYDFWKLLDLTLQNATELILKKYDIQITEENLRVIQSEYYPQLSLTYSGEYYNGYGRKSSTSIGGSFYPGYSQYSNSLGLNLNYELYKFGATDLKLKITQKEIQIIKNELKLAKEQISLELLDYYTKALKAQMQITYKEYIKGIQDRIVQKKWRLFEAGRLSKTELSRDQKSLTLLEKELINYRLHFIEAVKNIQTLSNISISPENKFAMLEPKKIKTKSFEETALAKSINLNLQKKRQELELYKKEYLPTIYASSGYRLYGNDDNSFLTAIKNIRKNSWDVGIGVKWNLFNGYKTDATIQKIQYEINKLSQQYQLAKFEYETKKKKRELLKKSLDKILQTETDLLSHTDMQEDMLIRLERAGQAPSIQLDQIDINKLQSELNFKLSVIEHAKATVSGELIN